MKGLEFYSTAAQVIPLFLILLAFQAPRSLTQRRLRRLSGGMGYSIVTLALTVESAALIAGHSEDPSLVHALLVWLALITLGALVFLAAVLAPGGLLSMDQSRGTDD